MSADPIRVEVRHHVSRGRVLGETTVRSVAELQKLAAQAWVTLDLPGEGVRSYRVHGYEWNRVDGEVVGQLFVET